MRLNSSLRARLLTISLVSIAVALALTGIALVILFRTHIERRFDGTLRDHLEEIAAAIEAGSDGRLKLSWEPADPRFKPPLSGWYWEVRSGSDVLRRSQSLGGATLPVASQGPGLPFSIREIYWPDDECLRVIVQDIRFPEKDQPLTVLVAGPRHEIRADVRSFAGLLAAALGLLAFVLGTLAFLQVGYGLRPLAAIRDALNDIRTGKHNRIDTEKGPNEVQPLIEEINALLAEREAKLERARTEAGDLAHALKTPIAIMANEAAAIGGDSGAALRTETRRMQRVVEHHLARARTAAGYRATGRSAAVAPVLADIRITIAKLSPDVALAIEPGERLCFAGDADDLGEMIGNLAENAAKWATSHIAVTAAAQGERLLVRVEDDGPGLEEGALAAATTRGERFDTRADFARRRGHGLGLSIVSELAALYGGTLTLGRSSLGGLRAVLDLPAARMPVASA